MRMTSIKMFLVMTIVELRQKVCWSFVFCVTKVFHDMVPLLPYLHGLHQLHLSLKQENKIKKNHFIFIIPTKMLKVIIHKMLKVCSQIHFSKSNQIIKHQNVFQNPVLIRPRNFQQHFIFFNFFKVLILNQITLLEFRNSGHKCHFSNFFSVNTQKGKI